MLGYNFLLHFILISYFSWFFCFIYEDFENQMINICNYWDIDIDNVIKIKKYLDNTEKSDTIII